MTTEINSPFTHDDYEILNREVPYQGRFRMANYDLRFRLFNGGTSKTINREVLERKSATGLLPYDPLTDRVLLIEQFRVGALANPQSPWLIEIIAGIIDKEESPKEVAYRESQEEAGCEVLDVYPIYEYFVSPGGSNEYMHLFCGRFDASQAGGLFGLAEEAEDIRAFTLPMDDAFRFLQMGRIKSAPAIIALQWLQLNRDWLKQLWQKN